MEILKIIADNPALIDALKKLLLEQFEIDTTPDTATDALLGQVYRAKLEGRKAVDRAFSEIRKYRTPTARTEMKNPAR